MKQSSDVSDEPRRRSRARSVLIDATKRLILKARAVSFTVDDLAREAQVARGTFYNHFSSLEELMTVTKSTVYADLKKVGFAVNEDSPDAPTKFARGLVSLMLYSYRDVSNAHTLIDLGAGMADPQSPANQFLVATLEEGISSSQFCVPGLDAAAAVVLGICDAGIFRMMEIHHEYSAVRELVYGLCVMSLRSLGADGQRIERIAEQAVNEYFEVPLGR